MHQHAIDSAVARATGEELPVIRDMGFNLLFTPLDLDESTEDRDGPESAQVEYLLKERSA